MKPISLCKEKTRMVLHDYLQLRYIFENYGNQKNYPKKAFLLLKVQNKVSMSLRPFTHILYAG